MRTAFCRAASLLPFGRMSDRTAKSKSLNYPGSLRPIADSVNAGSRG
jgi:hypothetical protein